MTTFKSDAKAASIVWDQAYGTHTQKAFLSGAEFGARRMIEELRAAILREQNYREFRDDQDGSAIGACKELLSYLGALECGLKKE